MGNIKVVKRLSGIDGLNLIIPEVHQDDRGYFFESYNEQDLKSVGIGIKFVQDNQSKSTKGVLRGLHFQKKHSQTKLVRVIRGEVFDVAVDLRADSPTYLHWHGEYLSEYNKNQFLIPKGFAHGFLVLSDEAEFCYKCDDFYHLGDEGGIAWNDPTINILWPKLRGTYNEKGQTVGYTIDGAPLCLSEKDKKWPKFSDTELI